MAAFMAGPIAVPYGRSYGCPLWLFLMAASMAVPYGRLYGRPYSCPLWPLLMAAPVAVPHGRSFWPPQRQLKRRAADGTVALQPAACACVTGVRPKTLFI